jgi:hypothetical protein
MAMKSRAIDIHRMGGKQLPTAFAALGCRRPTPRGQAVDAAASAADDYPLIHDSVPWSASV